MKKLLMFLFAVQGEIMKRFAVFIFGMFICAVAFADTETISWYKDGTVYDTTTCQTGDDIIVPTAPTKRGHVFNGWVFGYDFSTLDPDVAGTSQKNNAQQQTWSVTFPYGTIYGISVCSQTRGEAWATTGTPDESGAGETGRCWCKATEFVPDGSNIVYGNVSYSPWVFHTDRSSLCASQCASLCSSDLQRIPAFRRAIFGITQ